MSVCESKPYKNVDNIIITREKSIQTKEKKIYFETPKNLILSNATA